MLCVIMVTATHRTRHPTFPNFRAGSGQAPHTGHSSNSRRSSALIALTDLNADSETRNPGKRHLIDSTFRRTPSTRRVSAALPFSSSSYSDALVPTLCSPFGAQCNVLQGVEKVGEHDEEKARGRPYPTCWPATLTVWQSTSTHKKAQVRCDGTGQLRAFNGMMVASGQNRPENESATCHMPQRRLPRENADATRLGDATNRRNVLMVMARRTLAALARSRSRIPAVAARPRRQRAQTSALMLGMLLRQATWNTDRSGSGEREWCVRHGQANLRLEVAFRLAKADRRET